VRFRTTGRTDFVIAVVVIGVTGFRDVRSNIADVGTFASYSR
jgi:hypothetical protein